MKVCCVVEGEPKGVNSSQPGKPRMSRQLGGAAQGEWPVCGCSQASGGGLGPVVSARLLQLGEESWMRVQRAGNS